MLIIMTFKYHGMTNYCPILYSICQFIIMPLDLPHYQDPAPAIVILLALPFAACHSQIREVHWLHPHRRPLHPWHLHQSDHGRFPGAAAHHCLRPKDRPPGGCVLVLSMHR